jgi:hypothetical protein
MASTAPARGGHSPIPKLIVGLLALGLWLYATLLQIQTSEAFLENGPSVSFVPNWGILKQPYDLFVGHISSTAVKAVFSGWAIEIAFLICIVGYETAAEAVKKTNKGLVKFFRTGMIAIIVVNAIADSAYGTIGSGMLGQVGFAIVAGFAVMFAGIIGLHFIIEAGKSVTS